MSASSIIVGGIGGITQFAPTKFAMKSSGNVEVLSWDDLLEHAVDR